MDWIKLILKGYNSTVGYLSKSRQLELDERLLDIQTRLDEAHAERYPYFSETKIQKIEKELDRFMDSFFTEVKDNQARPDEDDS